MGDKQKPQMNNFEEAFDQAVQQMRELIQRGNVRHLVVTTPEGDVVLNTTLTIAVIVAVAMIIWMLPLLLLAVVVALVKRVRIDIVRVEDPTTAEHFTDEADPDALDYYDDENF